MQNELAVRNGKGGWEPAWGSCLFRSGLPYCDVRMSLIELSQSGRFLDLRCPEMMGA